MSTIDGYVRMVEHRLPHWLESRWEMISDLRGHLADRVAAGEDEAAVVASMEPPEEYAAALVADVPLVPATLVRRAGAFLLDVGLGLPLVLGLFFGSLWLASLTMPEWPTGMGALWLEGMRDLVALSAWALLALVLGSIGVSALVLSIVYFPLAEAIWGTTIGKHALGLCVVAENGTRVTWGKAILRRIPFYFEFFLLDAVFAVFTKRRQRAFDLVARTVVVRRPLLPWRGARPGDPARTGS
jgi:uncharacterized RDD family membrane protein YckC